MSHAAVAGREHAARLHPPLKERLEPGAEAWRPLVTAWVALFVVVTTAGLLIVGPLADGRSAHTDLRIERWLADHRTPVVNILAESLTWLAETVTVPLLCIIAIAIAWRASKNVAAPVFLALAVGGAKLVVAACRMYAGFHYLSDAIAGAIVGAVGLAVVYRTVLLRHDLSRRDGFAGGVEVVDGGAASRELGPSRPRATGTQPPFPATVSA